jgi:hypothetical protein
MAAQTVLGGLLTSGGDDQAALGRADPPGPARTGIVGEAGEAVAGEPSAPPADRVPGQAQVPSNGSAAPAIGRSQHDEGPLDRALEGGWATDQGFQILPLLNGEHEGSGRHWQCSS